jgi:predicted ATP-grasp superfamily ATP-dependent carboligase
MNKEKQLRPAIVVGLCAHGLDLVRALARRGVRVDAIESKRELPGVHTRLARVHFCEALAGRPLIDKILEVAAQSTSSGKPVLLLTNDRMVFDVAEHVEVLAAAVEISWRSSAKHVQTLLRKDHLPELCDRAQLSYPASVLLESAVPSEVRERLSGLRFPVVVKPVRPMGKFKVELVPNLAALEESLAEFRSELPLVVQEWIEGDVQSLLFCAIYFDKGQPLAHFEGRKLDTLPRGLGTTTAAERIEAPELYLATLRFFAAFPDLSGPVSLEVKVDSAGRYWVIEPTAFRTDYWAGCCIAGGVDFPFIEYCHQSGRESFRGQKSRSSTWIDVERNPAAILIVMRARPSLALRPWKLSFTYLALDDPRPALATAYRLAVRVLSAVGRRIRKRLSANVLG